MPLLSVEEISIETGPRRRRWFRYGFDEEKLVSGVTFAVDRGDCLGLVGGEASGKLPITFAILGLHSISDGRILFDGEEISGLAPRRFRPFRGRIQAVFHDGCEQLNPRHTLEFAFRQLIRIWFPASDKYEVLTRIEKAMDAVQLPAATRYLRPGDLDPDERQLAAIARALLPEPEFLICHEVTRGLDVAEQATVLNRICDVRDSRDLTLLLVTDNLAIANHMSDTIAILHHGKILETGSSGQIVENPEHEFTRRLVGSL